MELPWPLPTTWNRRVRIGGGEKRDPEPGPVVQPFPSPFLREVTPG